MPAPNSDEPRPLDSAALSRSIAAGDEHAFTRFYETWFGPTLALARGACRRDEAFCLDVVQDVMLTVANKMPALRDAAAVGAWMRRTVLHAVTDRLRTEARRQRREQLAAGARAAAAEVAEPWLALDSDEQRRWLAAQLRDLPAADRELLAARFSPVLTVTAAGALLGLGPDAAHGRLRRALERLRQLAQEVWS
ncbi:MAG: sigma-70 family RNA polymerase sigma factor [Planctomycetes bacterium]|nr:sigma-70 family RNA polymerase sigma factor [Planctomycetota bacterium]